MKNKLLCICLFFLTAVFCYGASYASNTVGYLRVAESNELPHGLFVKTYGYLPGDSISITNELNGSSVELLNLGSYAGTDAMVIVTSQVASALGLEKDVSYQIRVSTRSGDADSNFAGDIVILKKITDSKDNDIISEVSSDTFIEEPLLSESDNYSEENSKEEEEKESPIVKESDNNPPVSDKTEEMNTVSSTTEENIEVDEQKIEAKEDVKLTEEKTEENCFDDSEFYNDFTADNLSDEILHNEADDESISEDVEKEEPAEKHEIDEDIAVQSSPDYHEEEYFDEENYAADFTIDDKQKQLKMADEDTVIKEDSLVKNENPEFYSDGENLVDTKQSDDNKAVYETIEDNIFQELNETSGVEIAKADERTKEEIFSDDEFILDRQDNDEDTDESYKDEDVSLSDYEPIILVPSESKIPLSETEISEVKAEESKETKKTKEESKDKDDVIIIKPVEQKMADDEDEISCHVVSKESELKKGTYYIQIAILSDIANIKNLLKSYSKYPIVLIPSKKNTYKVLIGPLSVDEYGVVFEKFKSYGFKDAFVKKIK